MSQDPERLRLTALLERIKLLQEWLVRNDDEEVKQLLLRQRDEVYAEAKRLMAQGVEPLSDD